MKDMKVLYSLGRTHHSVKYAFTGLLLLASLVPSFSQITQTFTTDGTFTVPAGVTNITVEAWGGGGSGGGYSGIIRGGGGGGGAYSRSSFTVIPGENYSVTVGLGATCCGGDGQPGGASSFAGVVFANGGGGGIAGDLGGSGGAGGLGSGGVTFAGGAGGNGGPFSGGGGGSSGGTNSAGMSGTDGGVPGFAPSGGGNGGWGVSSGPAENGQLPGGGGGGTGDPGSGSFGADGKVIVSYTLPPPSAFIVGSILTTGGNFVANFWNGTNIGVDIFVPIANDPNLLNGTVQIQGKVGAGSFSNIGGTFTISAINTTKVVTLSDVVFESIPGFVDGAQIFVTAIITQGSAPFLSTTGTQSATIHTVDQTAPSAPATPDLNAASDTGWFNTDNVTNDLTPDFIISGSTAGNTYKIYSSLDPGIRGVQVSGGGNITIFTTLVSQGNHSITVTQTDVAGNTSSSSSSLNVTLDTTAPTIISVTFNASFSPAMDPSFNNCNGGAVTNTSTREYVHLITSEPLALSDGVYVSGWSASDGPLDISCSTAGGASVYHGPNTIHLKSDLDNSWFGATLYNYNGSGNSFDYAGNQMQPAVFCACDINPPKLASGMVFNPNGSGSEIITFTVDESLSTTTAANGVTGLSVNGTPFAGTYNTVGNTVTINSGVNGLWTSAATVSYSSGNLTDVSGLSMVPFGPEPMFLAPVSLSSNNVNPGRAKIGDVITVVFTAARTLLSAPIVTIGGNAATVSGSFPNYSANITATAGMAEAPIAFTITADEATKSTNVSVTTDESSVIFDKTSPTISPRTISSNNVNTSVAKPGDIISVGFSVNETLFAAPVVTIDGISAVVSGGPLNYSATITTNAANTTGAISFSISVQDQSGNPAIATTTTNASSVVFDKTPPVVSSIVRNSTVKAFGTSTNPIAASSVDFLVTFTEVNTPLSGINVSDFAVATDLGVSGASVTSVTGAGSSRTVQVSGITGTGRISLGVNDDDTILDAASNPLGGAGVNNGAVAPSFTASQFYTIVLPQPTASANGFSQSTTSTSVTIIWNDAVAPAQQATNYFVRLKKSTSSFSPATFVENTNDGADYTDTDFTDGTLGSYVAYDGSPTGTVTFTGLTSGTLYNIEIYPLTQTANYGVVNWDYKFTAPLTGNAATISAVSDIIKESTFTYPTDIPYVSSNNQVSDITTVTGVSLERFKIRDGGGSADADGLSTLLSSVTLRVTNYQYLKRLALYEVGASPGFASNVEIAELNVASTATNISGNVADFIFSGITTFSAPDNSENNFVVKATFNSLGIMDNSVISFAVVGLSNGAVSSIFANTAPTGVASSVSGNQNKIEVVTTRLDYTSFPAAGGLNLNFGPVVIEARDINANLDLDFVSPVSAFSNTDALGMINTPFTPNPILSFSGGMLTLPVNFQFTSSPATPPTQLSISAGGILNQLSPTFDIVSTFESQIKTDPSYIFSTNINYINFQAANIQPVDITGGIGSFELDRVLLSDGDADGLAGDTDGAATVLTSLTLQLTNYGHIQRIALYNSGSPGATELAEQPGSNFNGSGQITFSGLNIVAPDEGTTPISIRVSFNSNSSTITDNSLIRLSIAAAVAGNGSQFRNDPGFIGGVSGGLIAPANVNFVNVIATKLRFATQPSNTLLGVSMSPAVVIEAADANDVRDVSVGFTIGVTSTGTLSGSPQSVVFASGVGTYSSLLHTSSGTAFTLSTNSGPLTNATSATFNITTSNASDISANSGFSYPQNILHTSFQEAANIANTATSLVVAKFDIRDGGSSLNDSDVAPTILTALSLNLGSNFGFIRRIALYDALGTTEITSTEQAVSAQTVNFTGLTLTAADNALLSFTVRVSFTTAVTDNQQFSFTVSAASTQAANSSSFLLANAGAAASSTASNNNRINILPIVSSIVKSSTTNVWSTTNGTSATSANFTVTFSESVTGVDAADFTLTATGTTAGVKGAVTGGPSIYTVPVNSITGTGTLRLDFTSNGTVIDLFTVANSASFATGGVGGTYSIVLPEPANHVTSVSATAVSSTQARVDWTNAVAGQLPTHLLILAKRTGVGTYASVADGALVTAEEDFSNDNGATIVSLIANPTQTSYTFSNMVSNAAYDFVIYPYTLSANNTSDNTDYKIGSNPTATATLSFLTIASLNSVANGVAASPLPANSTSQAVFGFSMVSTGTQLVSRINIRTSSTSIGKLSNYKLVESSDNDFSTTGDNADISGTFTPSPTGVLISGLAESISTLKNYFLTADVNVAMNGATTPIQNSFTEVDVLVGSGVINSGTVTGTNYLFISSQNSDIVFTTGTSSNILYGSFQSSTGLTTANTAPLATFQIRDGAGDADNQNTVLNGLTLQFGNFANLRRVALFDGVTNVAEQDVTGDLVTFTGFSLIAPEASIKSFSVRGTFKTTVTDNQFIQVSVFAANAANTGSGFASSDAGGAATSGSVNKIVVTADRLYFASPPATVLINQNFGLTVNSVDVNNNADLDYGGTVTLSKFSGPGVFSSTDAGSLSRSLSSGAVSWSQLQLSVADVNPYSIRAKLTGLTDADVPINALISSGEPDTQTSVIVFGSISTTSVTVNFTNGNGLNGRILVAKSGSSVDSNPVDGFGYSANTIFGSGPQLGTGNYIVGVGSGPITITGLASGTTYFFRAYEFNGTGGTENYNVSTASGNPASVSTLATPTITSFDPTSGGVAAVVTITGTNFDPAFANNTVKFNGTTAVATASTNTSITTTVPAGATTGKITVTVNGVTATSSANFTVIPAPVINNFNPTIGVIGSPVTITGTNFDLTPSNNTVKFNGTPAVVTASTATSITTSVPTGATSGTITVKVGSQTATSTTSFTVTIIPAPTISSFTPSGGVGSTIIISGTEFTGATAVSFGGTNASSFNVVSATSITAVVAAGSSGSVSVTTPGGTATKAGFTFILVPTISSFIPTSAALGSTITIEGINFTGATAVSFGGTAATSFNIVSPTSVTAVVSSGASGSVSITTPEGTATKPGFIFIPAPTILSFTPSGGTGSTITITGTDFTGATAVSFGGTPAASFNVVSATSIAAIVASGASGNVSVSTQGGTATSSGFIFVPAPTISLFTPSGGTGATITITGTNFIGATAVSFGGAAAASFNVVSATSITAVVASGTSGTVTVTTPGGIATSAGFVFIAAPTISLFTPSGGIGATITIAGTNFTGTTVVSFGGTAATSFNVVSANSITAVVATGTSGTISVTTPGGTATSSGFVFIPAPTIISFTPSGVIAGSTITITGTDFTGATAVSFGGTAATSFNVISATSITAVVASGASGSVSVTTPGGTATKTGFTFIIDTTPPVLASNNTVASISAGSGLTFNVTYSDAESTVTGATVEYRVIETGGTSTSATMVASGNNWIFTLPTSTNFGALGLEYRFKAANSASLSSSFSPYYTLQVATTSVGGLTIPYSVFGTKTIDYRIFSVPLELNNPTLGDVLSDDLGGSPDIKKWRAAHYETASKETVYLNASSPIGPGKGYWLLIKDNTVTLDTGPGKTVNANSGNIFTIDLKDGWNQIGNPYNFDVNWNDVQAANPTVGKLMVWNGSYAEGSLKKYEGGFVKVTGNVSLKIPVIKSGRTTYSSDVNQNPIDEIDWKVLISMKQSNMQYNLGGVGMSPKASNGFDVLDNFTLPRLNDYLEFNHNRKVGGDFYSSDIVPTKENHQWEFSIDSNLPNEPVYMSWDNSYFGNGDKVLMLEDMKQNVLVNMSERSAYSFPFTKDNRFRILYGSLDYVLKESLSETARILSVSPNPSDGQFTVDYAVPNGKEQPVTISILDLMGKTVGTVVSKNHVGGFYKANWETSPAEPRLAGAIYLIQLKTNSNITYQRIIMR